MQAASIDHYVYVCVCVCNLRRDKTELFSSIEAKIAAGTILKPQCVSQDNLCVGYVDSAVCVCVGI